jgi:hypothetical protein
MTPPAAQNIEAIAKDRFAKGAIRVPLLPLQWPHAMIAMISG